MAARSKFTDWQRQRKSGIGEPRDVRFTLTLALSLKGEGQGESEEANRIFM